jgi:hypothetical protein
MAFDRRTAARSELARVERKALLFLAGVIVLLALGIALGWRLLRG